MKFSFNSLKLTFRPCLVGNIDYNPLKITFPSYDFYAPKSTLPNIYISYILPATTLKLMDRRRCLDRVGCWYCSIKYILFEMGNVSSTELNTSDWNKLSLWYRDLYSLHFQFVDTANLCWKFRWHLQTTPTER